MRVFNTQGAEHQCGVEQFQHQALFKQTSWYLLEAWDAAKPSLWQRKNVFLPPTHNTDFSQTPQRGSSWPLSLKKAKIKEIFPAGL